MKKYFSLFTIHFSLFTRIAIIGILLFFADAQASKLGDPITCCILPVQAKHRILYMGDSITDGGWGNSGGTSASSDKRNHTDMNHIFGHSYMMLCASQLMSDYPGEYECFNRGISGDDIPHLKARWQKDAIDINPDVLSFLEGTNDIHHYLEQREKKAPSLQGRAGGEAPFDMVAWEKGYRELLTMSREKNPNVIIMLGKPFTAKVGWVGKRADFPLRDSLLHEMSKRIDVIAKDFHAVVLNYDSLFAALPKAYSKVPMTNWIWDGIHPTPAGHRRMADLWLQTFKTLRLPYISASEIGTVTTNVTTPQPFTFDDVTGSLKDLTINSSQYKSVFDEPFFGFLKKMHDTYGTQFSLFCFTKSGDWKLEQVTGKYAKEFQKNSSWLKFGLHQGLETANYKDAPAGLATKDYKYFLKCMKTIVGGDKKCIASTIRLQNFAGNLTSCLELKKQGIKAFLGADDTRNSYYLDKDQSAQLVKDGSYIDKEHGLTFIRTERRLEKVKNADEYVKRYSSLSKGEDFSFFTHEYELLDKDTFELKPSMEKRIETICKFLAKDPLAPQGGTF